MTLIKMVFMLLSRFISNAGLRTAAGVLGLTLVAGSATADLVSPYGGETAPSFAELSVENDHVRVKLEIDLNAYPLFVAPDDGSEASLSSRTGQNFQVTADGVPLDRVLNTIDVRPRVPRQIAARALAPPRPRSEDVVFVDLSFPFENQPERITFLPPLNTNGLPLASIGMVAEHIGVPVTDYRYLSQAETMLPSWEDPWFTTFENPNLTRHHKSPLMSFLSVEPREVRHEIIFRLKDFEDWADLNLQDAQRLSPDQVTKIKAEAETFFKTQNPLTIDGKPAMPNSVLVSRIAVGADGLRVLPDQAEALRSTMLFGVVLSYPHSSLAQQVDMEWTLFQDALDTIPLTLSDPAGAVPSLIYKSDPSAVWNNHLTAWEDPQTHPVVVQTAGLTDIPQIALGFGLAALISAFLAWKSTSVIRMGFVGLFGAFTAAAIVTFPQKHPLPFASNGPPNETETHQVVQGLLTNVSTAMLEPVDSAFQEALTPFVTQNNRADVQAELRRGLSVTLPSGALARTENIVDLQVESISQSAEKDGHQILANWTAQVSGGHWGHLHRQTVSYRGLLDVSRQGDQWHLDGLTVLSAQQES